jgi:23S rRNA pseudouridine2604 synthase
VKRDDKMVLIALNKPQGIVCTTDQREPDNIIDFLKYGKRIYPVGRLDKDSEGLILLTNNGDIVNKILRAGNHHEKEYIVKVNKAMTSEFLKGMSNGVPILETVTRPCTIEALDKTTFRIILTQGLNRQIRRMCEYFGYKVLNLQRIRIMNIRLGHLQLGGYRNLTDYELEELKELIQESYNQAPSDEIDDEMVDVRVSDKKLHQKNTSAAGYKKKEYKGKNFAPSKDGKQSQGSKSYADHGKKKGYAASQDTVKAASKTAKYGAKDDTKYGAKDASKYGAKDASKYGSKDDTKYGAKDASKNGLKDASKYGAKDASKYGAKDAIKYGAKDASKYSSKDASKYGSKDASKYVAKDVSKYGAKDASKYGAKDTSKYGTKDSSKYASTKDSRDTRKGDGPSTYNSKDVVKFGTKYETKDTSKNGSRGVSKNGTKGDSRFASKDNGQDRRSVGQGKKEYGNAGQKTKNYRTNRTSR